MPLRVAVALLLLVALGCAPRQQDDAGDATSAPATPPPTAASPGSTPTTTTAAPAPDASPGSPPPPPAPLDEVTVGLVEVARLARPTALAVRNDDPALYVAERGGTVRVIREGQVAAEPLLDVSERTTTDGERGLLGLAFSPDGSLLYVSYTDRQGDSRIDEYQVRGASVDGGTRREILHVEQPYANHNGGNIVFGPDGSLYLGLGDGGGAGDPLEAGQSLETLLGSLMRIDPTGGQPYAIPADNPFVDREGARPEIWAYGLRNPWRFSFDAETADLWIADVGQNRREEINLATAGSSAGANYGWDALEGTLPFEGDAPADSVAPIFEYELRSGRCAITGGYVYRGEAIPQLRGAYLYGDFCEGRLQALRQEAGGVTEEAALGPQVDSLVSFGQDHAGELYVLSLDGPVYRVVAQE